jgi:hypothetical protein
MLLDVLRKALYKYIKIFILYKALVMDYYSLMDTSAR